MKKAFFTLFFSAVFMILNAQGWKKDQMQVRVFLNQTEDVLLLRELKIDFDFYRPYDDYVRAYVVPRELDQIKSLGLKYEIEFADLNHKEPVTEATLESYHNYSQIKAIADSLAQNASSICQKSVAGMSMGNRELMVLKISDNPAVDENEPEIAFDAGIHGDERIGPEVMIRFVRQICQKYGNDPAITELIDNREIFFYLIVNPDGLEADSRYNNNGVDLNRDYGYMWNGEGGSTGAYSQVETQALRDFFLANQFCAYTSYHSGTEFISYPWSYRSDECPDRAHIHQLAGVYSSAATGYSPPLPYQQGYFGMYPINGSSKDGNYGMMGAVAWSLEISMIKEPPASQIVTYCTYNFPAMQAIIHDCAYGLSGMITDAGTGLPVPASVYIGNSYPVYNDPVVGDYHKYLKQGTYTVKVQANGYQAAEINNVVVAAGETTTLNVQLQPLVQQFGHKMVACVIPNNNFGDEGTTPACLGGPDNINYSIGKNGWCIVDMLTPVQDGAGTDFKVFEGDATPEGYTCYVGNDIDGPFISLGNGSGTTSFDIALSGLDGARFIKIKDDGDGASTGQNIGFDLDAISTLESVSGVYVVMMSYEIEDPLGNSNGKLDPGETASVVITLKNNGTATAENLNGTLTTTDTYLTVISGPVSFGNLAAGSSAEASFTVSASSQTPAGHDALATLDITANSGNYSNSFDLEFVIGQIPVLIVDLDGNLNSGQVIQQACEDNSITPEYATSFPANLSDYSAIFVCLGIYDDNHVLSASEGQALADFLNAGGALYMEGGDTWYYDDATAVHPMFHIDGESDGTSDMSTVTGKTGTFTEGMSFSYSGDNSYMDHLAPISPAVKIFDNQSPVYGTGIAHEAGNYRTIGCSHEFGGLDDGSLPSTKANLMFEYLVFFGIIPEGIQAGFSADQTVVCTGETVHFTDNSFGNVTSWNWIFEGGTPSSSNLQNPDVIYNTAGSFDVSLTVSDGSVSDTKLMENYITVIDIPGIAALPAGPDSVCTNSTSNPSSLYTTAGAQYANTYTWSVEPAAAGTISGTGLTGTVYWNYAYEGTAQVKVKGVNACGEGAFSQAFTVVCYVLESVGEFSGSQEIALSPNPSDGRFSLLVPGNLGGEARVIIYNSNGIMVYEEMCTPQNGRIDIVLHGQTSGLYMIVLEHKDLGKRRAKFMIR